MRCEGRLQGQLRWVRDQMPSNPTISGGEEPGSDGAVCVASVQGKAIMVISERKVRENGSSMNPLVTDIR